MKYLDKFLNLLAKPKVFFIYIFILCPIVFWILIGHWIGTCIALVEFPALMIMIGGWKLFKEFIGEAFSFKT